MPTGREETGGTLTEDAVRLPPPQAAVSLAGGQASGSEELWSNLPQPASTYVAEESQLHNRKRPASKALDSTNLAIVHTAESVKKRRRDQTVESVGPVQGEGGTKADLTEEGLSRPQNKEDDGYPHHGSDGGHRVGEEYPSHAGEEDTTALPTSRPAEDISSLIKRVTMETRELLSKWQEPFKESEDFEAFSVLRVDQLLREAKALEQSLIQRKETLRQRLGALTDTLKRGSS